MNRRTFLRAAGGIAGSGILAGCGSDQPKGAPPRKTEVVNRVVGKENSLEIQLEEDPRVQSRVDVDDRPAGNINDQGVDEPVGSLVGSIFSGGIIGVASAKGRGGGKGGRGASAGVKTGKNGRAKWRGGAYGAWYSNHRDEIEWYDAVPVAVGIAFLGPDAADEGDLPGPGPVPWDKKWTTRDVAETVTETVTDSSTPRNTTANATRTVTRTQTNTGESTPDPSGRVEQVSSLTGSNLEYEVLRTGWFRVGTKLVYPENGYNFGYSSVDFKATRSDGSITVQNQWKVDPRL